MQSNLTSSAGDFLAGPAAPDLVQDCLRSALARAGLHGDGAPEEGLGHALRTPLTALHGALGLLGAGLAGDLPPDALALVSLALRNCTALERVVEAHLEELLDGDLPGGTHSR